MVLSGLTFNSGDIMDPVQAATAISYYAAEWQKFDLSKVHGMEYAPDWEMFKEMKRQGYLVTVGGFDKKGELKAFYVGTKSQHPYNPEWVLAHNCMLYLAPEYRKNPFVFKKFVKAIEAEMKKENVDLYSIVLPADERFAKAHKTIEKNGFNREDLVFLKRVK
jgi:hypothetical protein